MSLVKQPRNYSLAEKTRALLRQFGVSEAVAKQTNFWWHYSKTELEWILHDIKDSYRKQIAELHPDREGGDAEKATVLNSNFAELEKRFNARLKPQLRPARNKNSEPLPATVRVKLPALPKKKRRLEVDRQTGLTETEMKVVKLRTVGMKLSEVAATLGCSSRRIETVCSNAQAKLNVSNTVMLAHLALKRGWISNIYEEQKA